MRISLANILISACLLTTPALAKSSIKTAKSSSKSQQTIPSVMAAVTKVQTVPSGVVLPDAAKLIIGAGGIYAAFLYYGTLQEDVFHYVAADGTKFKAAWFLQTLGMSY